MHIVGEEYRNNFGTGRRTVVGDCRAKFSAKQTIANSHRIWSRFRSSTYSFMFWLNIFHYSNIVAVNTTLDKVVVLDSLNTGWCGKKQSGLFVLLFVSFIVQVFRIHSWDFWKLSFYGFCILKMTLCVYSFGMFIKPCNFIDLGFI